VGLQWLTVTLAGARVGRRTLPLPGAARDVDVWTSWTDCTPACRVDLDSRCQNDDDDDDDDGGGGARRRVSTISSCSSTPATCARPRTDSSSVKLKLHGSSFLVASSRGCRAYRACRRGCHEDSTRKLLPVEFQLKTVRHALDTADKRYRAAKR